MVEKVLLTDDEPGIRKVLGLTLADMGYRVLTAGSGREALDVFKKERPPVVFTDIKMPGMDGIELLRLIKQVDPDTEVIMISGHGDMDLAIESLKLEACDFVTKPINNDALEIALKRAWEKIGMRRQIRQHTENLEALVEEKSARYRLLFDAVPCYISVQDRDFQITAANRKFKSHFDVTENSRCYKVYRDRGDPCPDCPTVRTFADGRSHQAEMVVTSKTGDRQTVLIRTAPIIDAGGEISQVMEMATNITQIRRLQTHLSTLGLMVGTISHSIKGVLTGLDAGLYSLESGLEKQNPDRVEEGVEVVKLMVDRIRKVVLNVLYYARERELKWEKMDVRRLLTDAAAMVSPRTAGHPIRWSVEFLKPLGSFEVDPVMIRTALINILENAIEACIGDRTKDDHSILFSARREKEEITIEIRDDGTGMTPQQREQAFSLFFSSKGHTGTGMGLFISQRIIQQHGGSIAVESIQGKGTSFHIHLPRVLSETAKSGVAEFEQSALNNH